MSLKRFDLSNERGSKRQGGSDAILCLDMEFLDYIGQKIETNKDGRDASLAEVRSKLQVCRHWWLRGQEIRFPRQCAFEN